MCKYLRYKEECNKTLEETRKKFSPNGITNYTVQYNFDKKTSFYCSRSLPRKIDATVGGLRIEAAKLQHL